MGVVSGGVSGLDAHVHDLDVLVLEQDVMVGFEIDLQWVDWSAAAYRDRGCCSVRVLQFDFDGLGGGVGEAFDAMLFGRVAEDGAGRAAAFRGCAVGGGAGGGWL